MIQAFRLTVNGNIPHEHVEIFRHDEQPEVPNLFEDSQIMFRSKMGTFLVPDYNIVAVHLRKAPAIPPPGAFKVKRILLCYDLNYQDCYIIERPLYAAYDIPQMFRDYEQLAFMNKEGVFLVPDFQVHSIQV